MPSERQQEYSKKAIEIGLFTVIALKPDRVKR